ncbi:TPA: hypothetical protein U1C40_002337 [Streptococcus suis]|nr:hypothetical protein [Streptococcus suis]HEM3649635.1 hypothetical protein [Streptococcus suis]
MALPSRRKSPNLDLMAYSPLERLLSLPPFNRGLITHFIHTIRTLAILSRRNNL